MSRQCVWCRCRSRGVVDREAEKMEKEEEEGVEGEFYVVL